MQQKRQIGMRGGEGVDISIQKHEDHKLICINGNVIHDVEDYKIISSADGSTELIIHIKTNANTVKYDLSTNRG